MEEWEGEKLENKDARMSVDFVLAHLLYNCTVDYNSPCQCLHIAISEICIL